MSADHTNEIAGAAALNGSGAAETELVAWPRANPEACWLCTRAQPKRLHEDVRQLIVTAVMEHSRKPGEVYDRIERLVEGSYFELYAPARAARLGGVGATNCPSGCRCRPMIPKPARSSMRSLPPWRLRHERRSPSPQQQFHSLFQCDLRRRTAVDRGEGRARLLALAAAQLDGAAGDTSRAP
jgi:hypothetical protein